MLIELIKCTSADLAVLHEVGAEAFYETFKIENRQENMETYLENVFNINQLTREFSSAHSEFYFIYDHGEIAGYLKVNVKGA